MTQRADDAASTSSTPGGGSPGSSGIVAAPLTEQVYDTLRGWIVNGQLPAGYHLRVRDIAERVGTSVMPVREAVRRLVDAGLVVHEPYKGARVRGLDVDELEHAYDIRIMLEGEAARLGALRADATVPDRMHEHWLALEKASRLGDVEEALRRDEQLLDCLYAASGNDILREIISGLWGRCHPYKVLWAGDSARSGDVSIWHYKPELVAAVRANDGAEAERIIRESYLVAKTTLAAMLPDDSPG